MPNGRSRNRNSRHAARQRQLQQNQQLQAQAVPVEVEGAEPVIVEAVSVDETMEHLQEKIRELERINSINSLMINKIKKNHKKEIKEYEKIQNEDIRVGMGSGRMNADSIESISGIQAMLVGSEGFILKQVWDKYWNREFELDKLHKLQKDYINICSYIDKHIRSEYPVAAEEDEEKRIELTFHSGRMIHYLFDCNYGNDNYVSTKGIILKMNKGYAEDPEGNKIGKLNLDDMQVDWFVEWDKIYTKKNVKKYEGSDSHSFGMIHGAPVLVEDGFYRTETVNALFYKDGVKYIKREEDNVMMVYNRDDMCVGHWSYDRNDIVFNCDEGWDDIHKLMAEEEAKKGKKQ
tara:strand:+ start:89 stop:1129 length:1041 start_codon:yes stop_codon:yes gene_type:complete